MTAFAVALVGGCATADVTTPPSTLPLGRVQGVVTNLSDPSPPIGGPASEVYLFHTPEAPRSEAVRRAPITGGPQTFAFSVDSVPAGRYYLQACIEVGNGRACAPYTEYPGGPPLAFDVRAGAVTSVRVLF
jgi:hypothetical protein